MRSLASACKDKAGDEWPLNKLGIRVEGRRLRQRDPGSLWDTSILYTFWRNLKWRSTEQAGHQSWGQETQAKGPRIIMRHKYPLYFLKEFEIKIHRTSWASELKAGDSGKGTQDHYETQVSSILSEGIWYEDPLNKMDDRVEGRKPRQRDLGSSWVTTFEHSSLLGRIWNVSRMVNLISTYMYLV